MSSLLADSAAPQPTPPLAAQWKKIDALLAKDQTATAAPLVEKLYQQARREANTPAYVRALLYKVRLLEAKENDADEKAIALLEADLRTAAFPARPMLHSLLAGLYAQYFNQHRYQLYQRTSGAAPTTDPATPGQADGGTGLATWDARRLGSTILRHYHASVNDEPQRQLATPLTSLGDLVSDGNAEGRALRPSLYDLLAHRAIEGLQNQELTVTQPEQQVELASYPAAALFGSAREFAALRLEAPAADSLNHQLHALRLLQQLTARRLAQPDNPAALADVDLQRLTYLHGLLQDEGQTDQYGRALARMAEEYKALPISTEFTTQLAELTRTMTPNGPHAAVALAQLAESRFPKSRGAARARQLRLEIQQPEVRFDAAREVAPGQPWRLDLTARNVTGLHAWAYRLTPADRKQAERRDGRSLPQQYARALAAAPAATWQLAAPAPKGDYLEVKFAAAGPALPAGHYLVVLSSQATDPAQPRTGAATAFAEVQATELSALTRTDATTRHTSVLVLHRQSGQPLPGVQVQTEYNTYDNGKQVRRLGRPAQTDALGLADAPPPAGQEQRGYLDAVRVWRGPDTLLLDSPNGYANHPPEAGQPRQFDYLFTDRAIYRPGQTLYFKGIRTETAGTRTRLLTGQPVSVRLLDANGQTVQTLSFTSSADYGSFSGSVVLPTGRLNGQYRLETDHGGTSFAVEDYKRPTFLVQLDSVPGRPQLGQPLTLNGRARAYAGQATDGARVAYRVTRRALWPLFLHYARAYGRSIYPPGDQDRREIAHGTATTDAEGRFSITFTPPADPPPAGRRGYLPGYVFEVTADVTDAAGETRSATRPVIIGHNPLSLSLIGPEKMDRRQLPAVSLFSRNATGEPLPATGTLRLFARRFQPNPPGVPGPREEDPNVTPDELPGEVVKTLPFDTKQGAALDVAALLAGVPTGRYYLEARAAAPDTAAHARLDFALYDSEATTVPYATPDWVLALADTVAPGQPAPLLLGSSEADTRVLLEVERAGQLLRREWLTLPAGEQRRLSVASGPADAPGPLYVHTTQVRNNHLYRHDFTVPVMEPRQPLRLSLATFRDRLQPGQRETWRITIKQANGRPAEAELLATLYDQSLDVFQRHGFSQLEYTPSYYPALPAWHGEFSAQTSRTLAPGLPGVAVPEVEYPALETWGALDGFDGVLYEMAPGGAGRQRAMVARPLMAAAPAPSGRAADSAKMFKTKELSAEAAAGSAAPPPPPPPPPADLSAIAARSDFRETAFWMPALHTDANGDVVLEFQMPEAVTRWQLLALAHDRQLRSGQLARQLVTQKEVQLTPNAPRFLRPGDSFGFPAKFSNLTDHAVQGTAQLFLLDAGTGQDLTAQLLTGPAQQPVAAAAHQSQALSWPLTIPADFAPVAVTYRVVAQAGRGAAPTEAERGKRKKTKRADLERETKNENREATFTDGEENTLPVLPNRILVTESLPLPIVGPGTREFELARLTSTSSPTRRNQRLTLELTSNPAWYAVQSLPYLMEYPYECSEQVFSRLYANLLAARIVRANPRIRPVLAEWQRQAAGGTPAQQAALASKLMQNEDLKSVLLQETPWVRDAQSETERLSRLATLFDSTRTAAETTRALAKLRAMQLPDGSWPWFEKMPADRYITQLLVAGFGKLKVLGAFDAGQDDTARPLLQSALAYLDRTLTRDYDELRKIKGIRLPDDHLGDLQTQALYARSYWPAPAVAASARPAVAYYQGQAAKYWPSRTRYLQAQVALALYRADAKAPAARDILRALRENALHSPELGMYWKDVRPGYYWREAPTETQTTLLEAFADVAQDQKAVDEMKLWLLKQKQAQSWESTRATADACYALLLRGSNWLAPTQPLQVTVGGQPVAAGPAQAGTGYLRTTWPAAAIRPAQGKVTVTKPDAGVAWGALYWQYFEDLDKVTASASPLSLERQLYREVPSAAGPQLEKLTAASPLRVGEVLVVRLVLRTDRALEYVHLKDQRAAGLELTNPLSGYRYQGGLGYYESPRDAATHFFLGGVPRGIHVFEYRLRAAQAGDFSGGLSQVQCLYAPEFGATSAGQRLVVK